VPCYYPLKAIQSLTPNRKGVREISFQRFSSLLRGYELVQLPCGQCIGCRLERSRQWAMRCVHEASLHEKNSFITLTYNDEHLPANGGLSLYDFQCFMKRFRKRFGFMRFFHAGEYGDKNKRPHYHAIIFGFDFPDKKLFKSRGGIRVFTSEILESLWGKGFCTVGEVTFESAAYVARYVLKKVTGAAADAHYGGRCPDYVTMSRRPGIAAGWYEKNKTGVYVDDSDFIIMRGRKMKPPRFYDSRLKVESEETYNFIKRARRAMAILHSDDNTDERLVVKEKVKRQQISRLTREL